MRNLASEARIVRLVNEMLTNAAEQRASDIHIDALEKQQTAIEATYAKRLEAVSLEAEAEKLIMSNNQKEILDLLKKYAPDYNATGKSLGEQMLAGFKGKVKDFDKWFAQLTARIETAQKQLAALAQKAAALPATASASATTAVSNVRSVTVTQQNTFTVAVETPSETARRVQAANEALAQQLLR